MRTVTIRGELKSASHDFASEAEMVNSFLTVLAKKRSCFGRVAVTTEWDHRAGYVDVLARDCKKALIAFEAKLGDWKRAFRQAYRNTVYADRSYVLLPAGVADRALAHRQIFEDRGIGLCRFDGERVEVLVEAVDQPPLMARVRCKAHEHFDVISHEPRNRLRSRRGGDMRAART